MLSEEHRLGRNERLPYLRRSSQTGSIAPYELSSHYRSVVKERRPRVSTSLFILTTLIDDELRIELGQWQPLSIT